MEEIRHGQGAGRLTAQGEAGGTGQAEYLAAAEIDGGSHGQHSGSVSTAHDREGTLPSPAGVPCVTGR
ncbi:hypothetical protein GCM10010309_74130 [Streptomyces violaceochromogenes]|nr:hypothetical protein GCM10010309_74130 [Streptomyces violaceochromogenes]